MWLLALVVTTVVMIVSGIWSLIPWWLILFFFLWGIFKLYDKQDKEQEGSGEKEKDADQ